jgi:hypothetical protein
MLYSPYALVFPQLPEETPGIVAHAVIPNSGDPALFVTTPEMVAAGAAMKSMPELT